MKTILNISIIALIAGSLCAHAEVPVLTVDDQGNEKVTMISDSDYQNVTSAQANAFAQTAEDHVALASMSSHLSLQGILVGLEAAGTIGLGVFKLGTGINQQFFFEIRK